MRWFNNRSSGSISSWDDLVEQFTSHFQSMEILVKMEHLRFCCRETNEEFEKYVHRFRTLVSKMKDTPDLKEIVKICAMNASPVAWYLTSTGCTTFEELFDKILTYEELGRMAADTKAAKASSNDVSNYNRGGGYDQIPRYGMVVPMNALKQKMMFLAKISINGVI